MISKLLLPLVVKKIVFNLQDISPSIFGEAFACHLQPSVNSVALKRCLSLDGLSCNHAGCISCFFFHICILAHSLNRVCLDCSDDSEICTESPNKHDGDEDVVQVDFISVARHKQPGEHRSMQFKLNVLKIAAYLSMMFGFAHVDLYVQLLQEPAPLAVMSRMASLISLVKF